MLSWLVDLFVDELAHATAHQARRGRPPVDPSQIPHTRWGRVALVALASGALAGALEKSVGFGVMIAAPLLLLVLIGWRWSRSLREHRRTVRVAPATIGERLPNDR
jgi:hypothetical protein